MLLSVFLPAVIAQSIHAVVSFHKSLTYAPGALSVLPVFECIVGVSEVCQRDRHLKMVLAMMSLVDLEGALQELSRVAESAVGVAQVCPRVRNLKMVLAIMPLRNLAGALQELLLLYRVAKSAVGVSEVGQRDRHLKMVLAFMALLDL